MAGGCEVANPNYGLARPTFGFDADNGDALVDPRSNARGLVEPSSTDAGGLIVHTKDDASVASGDAGSAAPLDALASLATGLVAYFPIDEGSGTQLHDSTGGPTLVANQACTWVPARPGAASDSAMAFNGSAWAVSNGPASAAVNAAMEQITVAVWFNWTKPDNEDEALGGPDYTHWYFRLGAGSFRRPCFRISLSNGVRDLCGNTNIALDTWTHLAVAWDGTSIRMFINGQIDAIDNNATGVLPASPQQSFTIGAWGSGANPFMGALDDFRVYNRALSDAEISSLVTAR